MPHWLKIIPLPWEPSVPGFIDVGAQSEAEEHTFYVAPADCQNVGVGFREVPGVFADVEIHRERFTAGRIGVPVPKCARHDFWYCREPGVHFLI